jgi:hypothetical protein
MRLPVTKINLLTALVLGLGVTAACRTSSTGASVQSASQQEIPPAAPPGSTSRLFFVGSPPPSSVLLRYPSGPRGVRLGAELRQRVRGDARIRIHENNEIIVEY